MKETLTREERRRYSWLQIMAQTDEEYGKLLEDSAEADDMLQSLKKELTKDQISVIEEIIASNIAIGQQAFVLAAKYLVMEGE